MRHIILTIVLFMSLNCLGQKDTTVVISRENAPLQAVIDMDLGNTLFIGHEYTFTITTSGDFDIKMKVKNASAHIKSKNGTGGFRCTLIPIDTGECTISVYNIINADRSVSLIMQYFNVVNFYPPSIKLNGVASGQVLNEIEDSVRIQCGYSQEMGFRNNYKIKSWSVKIDNKTFNGKGCFFTKELVQYVNKINDGLLHLTVELDENETGYLKSEGVYIVRFDE